MKRTKSFLIGLICATLSTMCITGCRSVDAEATGKNPALSQIVPASGLEKLDVHVTILDKRSKIIRRGFGTGSFECPENYYNNTIDVRSFTSEYISRMNLFKSVSCATPSKEAYTLQMVWLSSLTNINAWIPFVVKYINHMEFDIKLISPAGKTVWTYHFKDQVTNTPSSFNFNPQLDVFQQRCMEPNLRAAMADLSKTIAANPELLK